MDRKQIKNRLFFWYTILWFFLLISLYISYFVYFVDTTSTKSKWVCLFSGAIAILFASCKICELSFLKEEKNIFNNLKNNILAYFTYKNQKNKILMFIIIIFSLLFYKFFNLKILICFLSGLFFSYINSVIVFFINLVVYKKDNDSCVSNIKLTEAAIVNSSMAASLVSFGFLLSIIVILFHLFKDYQVLCFFVFGVSLSSFFENIVQVITKKTVSNAQEFMFNFENNIENETVKKPLFLLNFLINNQINIVEFFKSISEAFSIILISAMITGGCCFDLMGAFLPLIICTNGLFASIIALLLINLNKVKKNIKTFLSLQIIAIVIFSILSFYTIHYWLYDFSFLIKVVVLGAFFGFISQFCNLDSIIDFFKPLQNISNSSCIGQNQVLTQSIKYGFRNVFLPLILMITFFITSFIISQGSENAVLGLFGCILMTLSYCIISCINSFINCYSQIFENYENTIEENNDFNLDVFSFRLSAFQKNHLNILTILTAISIIVPYILNTSIEELDILNPFFMVSILFGCSIPFLYSFFILSGATKQTRKLIFKVKKQIREFSEIPDNKINFDYLNSIKFCALNSSIQAFIYFLLITIPILCISFYLYKEIILAVFIGMILTSFGLILFSDSASYSIHGAVKYYKKKYYQKTDNIEYNALLKSENLLSFLKDVISPCLSALVKFLSILILASIILFYNL